MSDAEPTCKPESVLARGPRPQTSGDHSSGGRITAPLLRPTRKRAFQISNPDLRFENQRTEADSFHTASLFGLAPQGVCLAEPVARLAGDAFTSPFHHRPRRSGCLFSLAIFRPRPPPFRQPACCPAVPALSSPSPSSILTSYGVLT